jgi:N-acetylmuramoyl-L-alanine amidase
MKKYIFISLFFVACFLASSFTSKFKPIFGVKTVVIDAGHGGKDPGCHGAKYKEKDVALAVALKLGKYIEENMKDVKVVYTRKTDVFLELQQRAEIANKAKADLFICIHCNSACYRDKKLKKDICNDDANGAETYVMGIKNEQGKLDVAKRENSAILLEDNYVQKYDGFDPNSDESYIIMSMFTDTYLNQSLNFASKLQKQYKTKAGRQDKGVKRASLWVLWRTYMPSVLTEIGFLTNPAEEQFLGSTKGQDYVASCIFRAFREYKDEIEGTTKKYDDDFEKQETYKMTKEDSIEIESNKKIKLPPNIDSAIVAEDNKIKDVKKDDKKTEETVVKKEDKEIKKEDKIIAAPLIYKVQIASSDKPIPLTSDKFKGIEKVGEYVDKGIYKYTAGEFNKQEEAVKLQQKLRAQGLKDAFVIAMQDGKRVPLK